MSWLKKLLRVGSKWWSWWGWTSGIMSRYGLERWLVCRCTMYTYDPPLPHIKISHAETTKLMDTCDEVWRLDTSYNNIMRSRQNRTKWYGLPLLGVRPKRHVRVHEMQSLEDYRQETVPPEWDSAFSLSLCAWLILFSRMAERNRWRATNSWGKHTLIIIVYRKYYWFTIAGTRTEGSTKASTPVQSGER